ncbi:MAG: hypothetical protein FWE94_05560 [Coriobacteriia bacterium]|nr:hypothetical protein [Coriobacteriia bacterium]
MLSRYVKSVIWECLLCTVIAVCVSFTAGSGLYADRTAPHNLALQIVLAALLSLMLFSGAYDKKTASAAANVIVVAGLIAAGVLIVPGLLSMTQGRPGGANTLLGEPGNAYPLYLLPLLAALVVFLLTRTRTGTIVLFVAGMLILVLMQLLYKQEHLTAFLSFVVAAGALFIYKGYQRNAPETATAQGAFGKTFLVSGLLAVLMVALGIVVFRAVIAPLDPATREFNLATQQSAQTTPQDGEVAEEHLAPDEQKTGMPSDEGQRLLSPKGTETDEQKDSQNKNEPPPPPSGKMVPMSWYHLVAIPALAVLGVLGAVCMKLWSRKRWFTTLSKQSRDAQVRALYLLYLRKLKVLGIERRPDETLFQFTEKARQPLSRFSAEGLDAEGFGDFGAKKVDFAELTDTFVSVSYGGVEVAQDELNRWFAFHKAFYRNCKAHLGGFRYMVRFFAL